MANKKPHKYFQSLLFATRLKLALVESDITFAMLTCYSQFESVSIFNTIMITNFYTHAKTPLYISARIKRSAS